MSTKCLTTKYDGVVDNDTLLKVGEIRIKQSKIDSPTSLTQAIIVNGTDINVEIIGDGYITDKTLTENLGKTLSNVSSTFYVSNSDCEISIRSKYAITSLAFREGSINQWVNATTYINNKEVYVSDLSYSTNLTQLVATCVGNLSYISNCTNITILNNILNTLEGDLSDIKNMTSLSYLSLGSKVTGDIANLKNMTSLSYLSLGSKVTGDISNLSGMVNMSQVYLTYSSITGDISVLASMPNLSSIITPSNLTGSIDSLKNNSKLVNINVLWSPLTGDLALLPATCRTFQSGNGSYTWTTRQSTSNIISIISNPVIDNIDKMLQDQANCVVPSTLTKEISVKGTRTSASDEAVATLQSKGYTVSITPA